MVKPPKIRNSLINKHARQLTFFNDAGEHVVISGFNNFRHLLKIKKILLDLENGDREDLPVDISRLKINRCQLTRPRHLRRIKKEQLFDFVQSLEKDEKAPILLPNYIQADH